MAHNYGCSESDTDWAIYFHFHSRTEALLPGSTLYLLIGWGLLALSIYGIFFGRNIWAIILSLVTFIYLNTKWIFLAFIAQAIIYRCSCHHLAAPPPLCRRGKENVTSSPNEQKQIKTNNNDNLRKEDIEQWDRDFFLYNYWPLYGCEMSVCFTISRAIVNKTHSSAAASLTLPRQRAENTRIRLPPSTDCLYSAAHSHTLPGWGHFSLRHYRRGRNAKHLRDPKFSRTPMNISLLPDHCGTPIWPFKRGTFLIALSFTMKEIWDSTHVWADFQSKIAKQLHSRFSSVSHFGKFGQCLHSIATLLKLSYKSRTLFQWFRNQGFFKWHWNYFKFHKWLFFSLQK